MMKRLVQKRMTSELAVLILLLVILVAGCGEKETEAPSAVEGLEDEVLEETYKVPEIPEWYVPAHLTGLKVDPKVLQRRPVAVMVENTPAARPQSGLREADVIYEVMAEGGITRFLALYHSRDTQSVGPIRSARPYYIDRALEYDALYAHCGGSEDAKKYIKETKVADMDEFGLGRKGNAFWRVKDRKAPHNLYGDTAKIRSLGEQRGYKTLVEVPKFKFEEGLSSSEGTSAQKIYIDYPTKYSKVSYEFDPEQDTYFRFNAGSAHKDNTTAKQLEARNIIVQYTNTKTIDSVGRLQIQMTGQGKALLFSGGKVLEGTWEKRSSRAWTKFRDLQGQEFMLQPGQTWIQVVSKNIKVKYE